RGAAPEQDIDLLADAVALTTFPLKSDDRREELLRGDCAVPGLRRDETGVAVAAALTAIRTPVVLPEVGEQLRPATRDRLAEGEHRVEVLGEIAAVSLVPIRLVDEPTLLHDVLQSIGEPGRRRLPITPGTA